MNRHTFYAVQDLCIYIWRYVYTWLTFIMNKVLDHSRNWRPLDGDLWSWQVLFHFVSWCPEIDHMNEPGVKIQFSPFLVTSDTAGTLIRAGPDRPPRYHSLHIWDHGPAPPQKINWHVILSFGSDIEQYPSNGIRGKSEAKKEKKRPVKKLEEKAFVMTGLDDAD